MKQIVVIFALLLFVGVAFVQDYENYEDNSLPTAPKGYGWDMIKVDSYYNPPETNTEIVYVYLVENNQETIEIWHTSHKNEPNQTEVKIKSFTKKAFYKFNYLLPVKKKKTNTFEMREVRFFIWGENVSVFLLAKI